MSATRPRGFTLIELLVVIAIIAILAALLFPAYLNAKSGGQTARCLTHLKELYAALDMYMQEYHYWFPNRDFTRYEDTSRGRTGLYMPYVKNIEILRCQKSGSYGYNISCKAPCDTSWAWVAGSVASRVRVHKEQGHGAQDADGNPLPHSGRPIGDVKYASRMMVFICGQPGAFVDPNNPNLSVGQEANGWEWEPHDVGSDSSARMDRRHGAGTTYCFVDGHVKCLLPTGTKYGFPVATLGLDYDGDGTLGEVDFMR